MTKKGILTKKIVLVYAIALSLFCFLLRVYLPAITSITIRSSKLFKRSNQGLQMMALQEGAPTRITCDRANRRYDICSVDGPSVVDPSSMTIYTRGPTTASNSSSSPPLIHTIRPYPRKWENVVMAGIGEISLRLSEGPLVCHVYHSAPALVFSAGGYTGNVFHDFNDGFVPLFITVNSVFPQDQDLVLAVIDSKDWWAPKYAQILQVFSKHQIVLLNNDTATTHCFPSTTVGLITHGFMTINPNLMQNPKKTFLHLRQLLSKAYSNNKDNISHIVIDGQVRSASTPRPRLVFASRNGSTGRRILNEEEVKRVAEEVGFDVVVFEPTQDTSLSEVYALVNSSHAMVGVHGAALTHAMFLRPRAVLTQVVPIGAEGLGEVCFHRMAEGLGLEYVEYRVKPEESSLVEVYGKESVVVKDPGKVQNGTWKHEVMDMYLKQQDVRLDMNRFRACLVETYKKAKRFMEMEG